MMQTDITVVPPNTTTIAPNDGSPTTVLSTTQVSVTTINAGQIGPPGPTLGYPMFIQPTAPTGANLPAKYFWLQTGLGPLGQDFTIWFEDGT